MADYEEGESIYDDNNTSVMLVVEVARSNGKRDGGYREKPT